MITRAAMMIQPDLPREEGSWVASSEAVTLRTEARQQFVEITELVAERVRRSGVQDGLVLVQSRHTTAAVVVNEDEPLLIEDVGRMLERLIPRDLVYAHDDFARRTGIAPDEPVNGAAHCRCLLFGVSQTLHVAGGALQLGRWQRLFLVELDGPRARTLSILVMGRAKESR
jgi:secondary thiamine-phosphate synthase enzyme